MLRNKNEIFSWALEEEEGKFCGLDKRYGLDTLALCFLWGAAGPKDVQALTPEKALACYEDIWQQYLCSEMDDGLDLFFFDTALCSGLQNAPRWMRLVLDIEGLGVDMEVIRAAYEMGSETLVSGLEVFRRRRMKLDPAWPVHGQAWTNRVNRAKYKALQLAQRAQAFVETTVKVRHAHA